MYQAGPGHEPAVPKPMAPITFGAVPTLPVIPAVPRVVPAVRAAQSPVRSVRNGRRSGVIVPPVFAWYGGGVYPYTVPSASAPAGASRASTDVYPPPQDGAGYPGPYPQPPPASGSLELQLEPAAAQVYVDGYYTGIVSDFERPGGVRMEPGPHRIEIRAQAYETALRCPADDGSNRSLPRGPATVERRRTATHGTQSADAHHVLRHRRLLCGQCPTDRDEVAARMRSRSSQDLRRSTLA